MEKILVTGGLGFIGSHIAEHFWKNGYSVAVIDNSSSGFNISDFKKGVETVHASITDYEKVLSATRDARLVFHEAAITSVPFSIENPRLTMEVNVKGTLNVLRAARENGARRVILASSSAIYGSNRPPLCENMKPDPLSPYARSKLENEKNAHDFYKKHGLETVSLRYFNVYGPRQDPHSQYSAVIPAFMAALKSGKRPAIHGDGTQTRDFIYVKDVVLANVLAASAGKNALGETFNIASGNPTSISALLGKISRIMGREPEPIFEPARKGDIVHSYADISLAKKVLGFEPRVGLDDGLKETASFFL